MEIEIIDEKTEVLRKDYIIKNDIELKSNINTLLNKFLKTKDDNYFEWREDLKRIVKTAVELGFNEGKLFGKETIIYKESGKDEYQPKHEEVYRERSDNYVGD